MNRLLRISLFVLFIIPAGCAGERKAMPGDPPASKSRLTEDQRLNFEHYFFEANRNRVLGNRKEAIENLEKCLLIDPKSSAVYFMLSQLYNEANRPTPALEAIQKAVSFEPDNEWYLVQQAEIHERLKQHAEAARIYRRLSQQHPSNSSYYMNEGAQWFYAGKITEAIGAYDRLEKEVGINEETSQLKEDLYLGINKPDKALAEIKKLIKAYPEEIRYKGMLGELYLLIKRYDEAFATYNEVLQIDPQNGYAHFGLARYYQIKENDTASFNELKLGFADARTDIKNKLNVMLSYFQMLDKPERKKEAYELAEILVKTHPADAPALAIYADLLFEDQKLEESHTYLKKALSIEKADFTAWQKLLMIDESLKNYQYMFEDATQAIEYFPNQMALYIYGSFASYQLKNYRKMADLSKSGLEMALLADEQIQFHINLGDAYNYLKMYDSSDYHYKEALDLDSNNALVLNNYAYFLSVRNTHLEKAEHLSAKSLKLDPGNASYLDTYGWILYKQKQYNEAADYIRQSLDKAPESPEVLEHYGDVLYRLGKRSEALQYWKKARENGGDSPSLEQKINEQKLPE